MGSLTAGTVADAHRPRDVSLHPGRSRAALGRTVLAPNPQHPNYRTLTADPAEPELLVQSSVGHESRVHMDLEADDQ